MPSSSFLPFRHSQIMLFFAAIVLMALVPLTGGYLYAKPPSASALKQFNTKYAPQIRSAQAKNQQAKLNNLAMQMLDQAKELKDVDPDYAALLCDRTYAISARNKTRLKQAAQAAKMLIEITPDEERKALEKLTRVYLLAYENLRKYDPRYKTAGQSLSEMFLRISWLKSLEGDKDGAIAAAQRAVAIARAAEHPHLMDQGEMLEKRIPDIVAFEKHVAEAKKTLSQSPKDQKANYTMAMAYLVYQDDPETALPYARLGMQPENTFKVQLAADPLGSVSGDFYLELAIWYMGHAMKHKSEVSYRVSMAIRARLYAEYYLSQISLGKVSGLKADGEIVRDRAKQLAMSTGISGNDFDDMTGELAMELGTMENQAYRQALNSAKPTFGQNKPTKKAPKQAPRKVATTLEIDNQKVKTKPKKTQPKIAVKTKRKRSITKVEPPKYKGPGDDSMGGGRSIFDF